MRSAPAVMPGIAGGTTASTSMSTGRAANSRYAGGALVAFTNPGTRGNASDAPAVSSTRCAPLVVVGRRDAETYRTSAWSPSAVDSVTVPPPGGNAEMPGTPTTAWRPPGETETMGYARGSAVMALCGNLASSARSPSSSWSWPTENCIPAGPLTSAGTCSTLVYSTVTACPSLVTTRSSSGPGGKRPPAGAEQRRVSRSGETNDTTHVIGSAPGPACTASCGKAMPFGASSSMPSATARTSEYG
mmetsp:Transcript_27222/g.64450  ORF Transcript_27222/g.64450 Transcript_27222/m.64450 type:complete len:245 (-) Transcript_27222:108-842(-)